MLIAERQFEECIHVPSYAFQILLSFLMTDSICHSSLPRTVLEKVTDYYSISYLSAHKSRPNVSMCVY